jgi:hypothetical protein
MAKRVQRKMIKGWRMPEGAVYVGRPTKWGNPFKVVGDMIYGNASHRRKFLDPWILIEPDENDFIDWRLPTKDIIISLYEKWLAGNDNNFIIPPPTEIELLSLRGRDLACFCRLDQKCHADVLLELTNK